MTRPVDEYARDYFGWRVVAIGFICLFFTFGAPTFLLPVVYADITAEFGWSRASVTQIAAWKFLAAAASALFMSRIIQKIGLRATIVTGSILTGCAMLGFYEVSSQRAFYVLGGALGACAILMMIAVKILVSRWFHLRQGFAVGLTLVGASVAGAIVPVIATPVIEAMGWRAAFGIMTLGIWFIALPVYLVFCKDRPEDVGHIAPGTDAATENRSDVETSLAPVFREPRFWLITAGLFLVGFVDQALNQHTPIFLEKDLGFSRRAASTAFALTFAIGIFSKVFFGWLYDRASVRGIMACYVLMAVAVLLAFPISGPVTITLFVMARGFAHGGLIADAPVLAKHCYGTKNLSSLIAVFTGVLTLGYSAGIFAVGAIYEHFGDYIVAFSLMALLSVIAAILLIWVTPSYWLSLKKAAKG